MTRRPQTIPSLIAIGFLLLAGLDWPYGYYTLLRLVVCAAACWIAFVSFKSESSFRWVGWPFALIALLFNPIAPVHLDREVWGVIDLVVAAVFGIAIWPSLATMDETGAEVPDNTGQSHSQGR